MAEVKCIVGYPSPPKTTQVTSDAYLIKWVEQVDNQHLERTWSFVCLELEQYLDGD